jgi:hypothetical protein
MKKLLINMGLLICLNVNAQWTYKTVDNDFDEPYRICYTKSSNSNYLKLENVDGEIFFYMKGGYYCDENPTIDLAFIVKGVSKKYSVYGSVSEEKDILWIMNDLLENNEILLDFKSCTTLKIRVNDNICESEIFSFNMSGSTSALNFIRNN